MQSRSKKTAPTDRYTRGVRLYRQGRYEEARKELEALLGQDDLSGRVARFYCGMADRAAGIEAMRTGDLELAEQKLRSAVEVIGRHGDLSSYLAALYVRTGRYDRCVGEQEKLSACRGDTPSVWRKLAQAQWRAGRRSEAYMTLTSALRRMGGHAELHLQLGLFYASDEQWRLARGHLGRAAEADNTNAEAHYYLGLVAAASADVNSAVQSFRRAFELRPNDLMLAYQLAKTARAAEENGHRVVIRPPERSAGRSDGSEIRQLAQYVSEETDFVEAFLSLPPSEVDAELFGTLLGVVQMALADHGEFADLHLCCSRIFHRLDRRAEAVRHARCALKINPSYVRARLHLAELCAESDRPFEAAGHLERAIADGADWPDVHCMAGDIMHRCNQNEKARRHLERALQLKSNYGPAAELLDSMAA